MSRFSLAMEYVDQSDPDRLVVRSTIWGWLIGSGFIIAGIVGTVWSGPELQQKFAKAGLKTLFDGPDIIIFAATVLFIVIGAGIVFSQRFKRLVIDRRSAVLRHGKTEIPFADVAGIAVIRQGPKTRRERRNGRTYVVTYFDFHAAAVCRDGRRIELSCADESPDEPKRMANLVADFIGLARPDDSQSRLTADEP